MRQREIIICAGAAMRTVATITVADRFFVLLSRIDRSRRCYDDRFRGVRCSGCAGVRRSRRPCTQNDSPRAAEYVASRASLVGRSVVWLVDPTRRNCHWLHVVTTDRSRLHSFFLCVGGTVNRYDTIRYDVLAYSSSSSSFSFIYTKLIPYY